MKGNNLRALHPHPSPESVMFPTHKLHRCKAVMVQGQFITPTFPSLNSETRKIEE